MNGPTPHVIWSALRRARLFRVLAVYLSASFVVLEVVDIFTERLGLPDWFFPGAVVLLIIGLPIVVTTALVQAWSGPEPAGGGGHGRDAAAGAGEAGKAPAAAEPVNARAAAEPANAPAAAGAAAVARRWLTWRKAVVGGVGAFALWGLIVAAYMAMRMLGIGPVGSLIASGEIERHEPVLIADFANHTPDSLLSLGVTEAFRVDLAQSPVITVVEPTQVRQALARMRRGGDIGPLTAELAREVAVREGIKAVVAGEIAAVGSAYTLSVHLIEAADGESLASFRETAADSTEIITAVDALSNDLRTRIGESLTTVRAGEPLERVTTSSLEALRKYSQAARLLDSEGDFAGAMALLEDAIARDSTFAMAWRKLAVALSNRGEDRTREIEAAERALEYSDRLTDRERYHADAYYWLTLGDRERAMTAYRTLLRSHPNDRIALNNHAFMSFERRDYRRAEELYRRAVAADPYGTASAYNLVRTLYSLGKATEARTAAEDFYTRFPEHRLTPSIRAHFAHVDGDYAAAERRVREYGELYRGDLREEAVAARGLAILNLRAGRVAAADRRLREASALERRRGMPERVLGLAGMRAGVQLEVAGRPAEARRILDGALEQTPLAKIPPADRPYVVLARGYALANRPDRARALIARFEAEVPPEHRIDSEAEIAGVRGHIALAEGRPDDAIRAYRRWDEGLTCPICALPHLARAYTAAGQPDSAIAAWERYLDTPWLTRVLEDGFSLPRAHERLGDLYEERGEFARAAEHYARFVELWRDADPELRPRIEAAERALERLAGESAPAGG